MSAQVQTIPAGLTAENAQNHQDIERQFAVKAVLHAQTYWNILEKVPGRQLRLTKLDNEIYEHFKRDFPDFDVSQVIDEDEMKGPAGKARWRKFMSVYEKSIEDYNFGTLMRNDAKAEYTETTTIFVQRMQFYAIEIARNKEGLNDWIKQAVEAEEAAKAGKGKGKAVEDKKENMNEVPARK